MAKSGPKGPHRPINWETFEALCKVQCTSTEIAGALNISIAKLRRDVKKQYKQPIEEVLHTFRASGKASLRRQLFVVAQKGNPQVLIHLAKNYLGHTDKLETSSDITASVETKKMEVNITGLLGGDATTVDLVRQLTEHTVAKETEQNQ